MLRPQGYAVCPYTFRRELQNTKFVNLIVSVECGTTLNLLNFMGHQDREKKWWSKGVKNHSLYFCRTHLRNGIISSACHRQTSKYLCPRKKKQTSINIKKTATYHSLLRILGFYREKYSLILVVNKALMMIMLIWRIWCRLISVSGIWCIKELGKEDVYGVGSESRTDNSCPLLQKLLLFCNHARIFLDSRSWPKVSQAHKKVPVWNTSLGHVPAQRSLACLSAF